MSTSPKVVVVTGASQGIGAEVVKAFRKLDYRIVATARSMKPSDDANMLTVGVYIGKPFTEHTAEDFAAVVNVNMAGFYYITQLAIAEMERHSSGHVVSVTSSAVDAAISGVYSVLAALTKGGLNAATKSLAIEYARKGIRVNAVAPGIIKTPMHAPETHEALGAFHPLGRMGEMSDIADAILFLDSAPFITGEILHVDGGQSAGH